MGIKSSELLKIAINSKLTFLNNDRLSWYKTTTLIITKVFFISSLTGIMKIITWNCNGAFRKKYEAISALDADVYIIQECEDPIQTKDQGYKDFASNYIWIGDTKKQRSWNIRKGKTYIKKIRLD